MLRVLSFAFFLLLLLLLLRLLLLLLLLLMLLMLVNGVMVSLRSFAQTCFSSNVFPQ